MGQEEMMRLGKERLKRTHVAGALRKQSSHELARNSASQLRWRNVLNNELNRRLHLLSEVNHWRKQLALFLRTNTGLKNRNLKLHREKEREHAEKVHMRELIS